MALDFLENSLHSLCISIHVDDVRRRQYKRYMDLSRSINSLKFNKGVILKNVEEGAPDYEAFVKCLSKKKNFETDKTQCASPCQNDPRQSDPCASPNQSDPCGSCQQNNPCGSCQQSDPSSTPCVQIDPCGSSRPADPCGSPCPTDRREQGGNECPVDEDVCEMLELIGDTTPIILMDLLDHKPDILARAMARDDDECDITINVGSSECLPDDEACLEEQNIKEARRDEAKSVICQLKNVELFFSRFFELTDERDFSPDGTYREGSGAMLDPEQRHRDLEAKKSCQGNL